MSSLGINWVVDSTNLNFVIKSVVGVIFAALAIKAYDGATGEMPTLMKKPIAYFTTMVFVFSLFAGYQHSQGNSAGWLGDFLFGKPQAPIIEQVDVQTPIETLTLATIESFPMTNKCYHTGEQVKVNIIGGPVKMALGEVLPEGEHIINVTSDGRLCFHIENNTPAKVEVY
jgi:hypothetical protein